jgi:lipid-A-disaccharide synthase
MSLNKSSCYLISAGEFSGDLLAAELVKSLRKIREDLKPYGIVGETMRHEGVEPLAGIEELSVMGIVEVARRIADIRMLEQRILAWVDRMNPQFAVLVDFPGFHFRLAEQLHLRGVPVYQYVAPKVWAWGQKRVALLRDHFKAVLGVLPFEEDFFLRHGVNYHYVGSPHYDRMRGLRVDSAALGIPQSKNFYAFLPGSRMSELRGILPVMQRIRKELSRMDQEALCVIPLAPGLEWSAVKGILGDVEERYLAEDRWEAGGFLWIRGHSLEVMKGAQSAVVASGTATLECALAGTPMAVIYVMNDLSYAIAKRAVSLRWVSLVNLLMNREVVREFIQAIDPLKVAREVFDLARGTEQRARMVADFAELNQKLLPGGSDNAAAYIVNDSFGGGGS